MVLAPMPEGQARECACGGRLGVPQDVPMAEADRRVRAWMVEHAKTCLEMRATLAAQGGPYLSR